jgi:sugar diacid utilization regulator
MQRTVRRGTHTKQRGSSVDAPILSGVIKALGPSVAHLVGGDDGIDRAVSTLILHDPLTEIRRVASGFLLAIGVLPTGDAWRELLKTASQSGYVCVAVKPSGVSPQQLRDSAAESELAVLSLADEISWEQFVMLASSAMRHSYSSQAALGNPRLGDLFALANAVATTVGGATAIVDSRQNVIAYSTVEGQPVDETRRKSILGLRVPSSPATDVEYRAVHGASGVIGLSASNSDYPRLAVPIRAGGELLGSVWVIDEKGAASEAMKVGLQHAVDIAALHLLQARTEARVTDRRRGDMLSAVLDDAATASGAARTLGLSVTREIRIVAISIADQSAGATAYHQILELAIVHCGSELGFSAATVRSDVLLLLLPVVSGERDHAALTRLLRGIDAHARRSYGYRLVIGLGGAVSGLAEAGKSMVQAEWVVRLLKRDLESHGMSGDEPLIGFSESFTARMALLTLSEHVGDLDEAAGNTIATMLEYDSRKASDYVPTLKAFFNAHGNISEMAQLLHVHANSCRYRMTRIADVFDIDLDDPDSRLVLWLQLRLHELCG